MLLIVAESSGSSPGRQGYKMAIGTDGELTGSIGGGVMEVSLVEQSRRILSETPAVADGLTSFIKAQQHRKKSPNPSGMICSGRQTVIFRLFSQTDIDHVCSVIDALKDRRRAFLNISNRAISLSTYKRGVQKSDFRFEKLSDIEFVYTEKLGFKHDLFIIGGGHCSLALSELMSKMDFYIRLFDDRPDLNTIDKNRFAHEISILENYETIAESIPSGSRSYVVVMTLGYRSDEIVIRSLLQRDLKYFGVLGSKAKMKTLLQALRNEGVPPEKLAAIHTPIGLAINSRTPEEIAVSIAAEIISVKNA